MRPNGVIETLELHYFIKLTNVLSFSGYHKFNFFTLMELYHVHELVRYAYKCRAPAKSCRTVLISIRSIYGELLTVCTMAPLPP